MRIIKIMLTTLPLGAIAVILLSSCSSRADSTGVEEKVVTVKRGNLTTDITAAGNLALSHKEDLAFEMDGTVEEVLVVEAESVEEGQLLAKLDISAWENQVKALELKLTEAQRQVTVKERAVTAAERQVTVKGRAVTAAERQVTVKERAVTTAERQVVVKELNLLQAQVNLQTAEDNLYKVEEVAEADNTVKDAEWDLSIVQARLKETLATDPSGGASNYWLNQRTQVEQRLAAARKELKDILAGSSVKVTTDVATELAMKQLEIEINQGRVEDAQIAIEDARQAVDDARQAVDDARQAVEDARQAVVDAQQAVVDARQAVVDAQEALDEALNISPEIIAPFAGFITKVNVKGGDTVKKGTVALVIADPNKFEADILVNEMNLLHVKLGGQPQCRWTPCQGWFFQRKWLTFHQQPLFSQAW